MGQGDRDGRCPLLNRRGFHLGVGEWSPRHERRCSERPNQKARRWCGHHGLLEGLTEREIVPEGPKGQPCPRENLITAFGTAALRHQAVAKGLSLSFR